MGVFSVLSDLTDFNDCRDLRVFRVYKVFKVIKVFNEINTKVEKKYDRDKSRFSTFANKAVLSNLNLK